MRINGIEPKRCIVLSKSNPAPFNRDRLFVNDVEFAIWGTFGKGWKFNRQLPLEKCVIPTKVQSKKLHPTMKDLTVIEKLISLLSNKEDTLLDMFAGSGTTGVACKNLNRNFILIEKEPEYIEIINKRLYE